MFVFLVAGRWQRGRRFRRFDGRFSQRFIERFDGQFHDGRDEHRLDGVGLDQRHVEFEPKHEWHFDEYFHFEHGGLFERFIDAINLIGRY
jgi:hypothetical protein